MKVVDTNILARFFIDDPNDAESQKQKADIIEIMTQSIHIPITVILEFEWVMRGFYKLPKDEILKIFQILLSYDNIDIESHHYVKTAVELFEQGFDFADAIHISRSQKMGGMLTFDKQFFNKANRAALDIELVKVSKG